MARITFNELKIWANKCGFQLERKGKTYEIFSNEKIPGVTIITHNLQEAYQELWNEIYK